MDYSRIEVAVAARKWFMKFGWLGRVGSELPRVSYDEANAVRSVHPKGKNCRLKYWRTSQEESITFHDYKLGNIDSMFIEINIDNFYE